MTTPARARLRAAAKWLALVVLTLASFEIVLQLSGWYAKSQLGRAVDPPPRSDRFRILALGDSNTFGLYLEPADAYPAQLQERWNSGLSREIEVINLGYPGTNTATIVAHLAKAAATFQPDLVLIMVGVNDYWTVNVGGGIGEPGEDASMVASILGRSRVFKLISLLLAPAEPAESEERHVIDRESLTETEAAAIAKSVAQKLETEETRGEAVRIGEHDFDFRYRMRPASEEGRLVAPRIAANVHRIVETSRALGLDVVFLTYPSNQDFYRLANRALRAALGGEGAPLLIDLAAAFDCTHPADCEQYFFPDHHASAKGNAVVAERLVEVLAPRLNGADRAAP